MSELKPTKTHHLKTIQPYYDLVKRGIKTFEIRKMIGISR
jgi:hypothetical protein